MVQKQMMSVRFRGGNFGYLVMKSIEVLMTFKTSIALELRFKHMVKKARTYISTRIHM